jgi:histone H3/H4
MMKMKRKFFIGLVFGMALPLAATAGSVTIANTFSSGTPAVAVDVNQNFSDVAAAVNDNHGRITTNEGAIATNATAISGNASAITANGLAIGSNTAAIGTNATNISAAGTAISNNAAGVISNAARITTNEGNISSHSTTIAGNTSAIATHEVRITANEGDVAANSTAIAGNTSDITTVVNDVAINTDDITQNAANIAGHASRITQNELDVAGNATNIATNTADIAALQGAAGTSAGAVYRWNAFSSFHPTGSSYWFASDNPALFGGVAPSVWGNGSGRAVQMSPDKDLLRTLFTRKGYGGKNALVYADEWLGNTFKNIVALFRIKNVTTADITWAPVAHFTASPGNYSHASVALNGVEVWDCGTTGYSVSTAPVSLSMQIPANRTTTVIFVSGLSADAVLTGNVLQRSTILAFVNDSLALPAGLEYVDDLDTAAGGWEQ